ncbi:MAG: phosphoserine transaminase [Alphaproteobacteria bacterium]|nr:phosphoserine transaminase [Alphaproteobacteria bacterium]
MTGKHPAVRPARPFFSSGPCAKRPGWTPEVLDTALLGRSHRSGPGKARLKDAIDRTKTLLGVPEGFRCAIVPASDTGAMELAMWSLLGPRPVDVFAWESFGEDWVTDTVKQLKIAGARSIKAPYGELPDLGQADPKHDTVFTWNGTTGGVRVPNADWIAADRDGVVVCDATSAAFAMDLDWSKLDAVTFSWQKVLGGEAAHGMLVLSPRAVARLESHTPSWPMPKLFRLTKGGKLNEAVFEGETINTPSMLAVEDYLDTLAWAEGLGGLQALKARVAANFAALTCWVNDTRWIDFLASDRTIRSPTSVCLKIVDPDFVGLGENERHGAIKTMADLLEAEAVAFDVAGHRNAPPGLRIWCGATVETSEIEALGPWLDWAWKETRT